MKKFSVCLLAAALLTGCVTDGSPPMGEVDNDEAARLNTQLGINYMRQGNYPLALEKLKRALEQDPKLPDANTAIAVVYGEMGDHRMAEKHYRRAMSLDSNNPEVLNNFGVFLCEQGNTEDAERYFLKAIKDRSYSTPELAYTNAGVCARREGDMARAEQFFRSALKANPNFSDALEQMAALSYDRNEFFRARAFLQRYTASSEHTPSTLLLSIKTERALGDFRQASEYASMLRRQYPESDEAYELLSSGNYE